MQIYGPAQLHGPQAISSPHVRPASSDPAGSLQPAQDELQISDAGRLVDLANQVPDIRQNRVDSIRAQIAAGTYETPDKLDVALNRFLDEVA
ncbi:MAG TPA: flagellar biosynthesis anti-sigma factor FlgM [Pirellulales bacterium]|nr:flagellar biosynthesis anti-sigma factor FlgM [Pirellulales bacterium]